MGAIHIEDPVKVQADLAELPMLGAGSGEEREPGNGEGASDTSTDLDDEPMPG